MRRGVVAAGFGGGVDLKGRARGCGLGLGSRRSGTRKLDGFKPCLEVEVEDVGLAVEVEVEGTRLRTAGLAAGRSFELAREREPERSLETESLRSETAASDCSSLLESSLEAAGGRPRSLVGLSFLLVPRWPPAWASWACEPLRRPAPCPWSASRALRRAQRPSRPPPLNRE